MRQFAAWLAPIQYYCCSTRCVATAEKLAQRHHPWNAVGALQTAAGKVALSVSREGRRRARVLREERDGLGKNRDNDLLGDPRFQDDTPARVINSGPRLAPCTVD